MTKLKSRPHVVRRSFDDGKPEPATGLFIAKNTKERIKYALPVIFLNVWQRTVPDIPMFYSSQRTALSSSP